VFTRRRGEERENPPIGSVLLPIGSAKKMDSGAGFLDLDLGKKESFRIGFKTEEWELSGLWVLNESKESGVGV